jgi:hypothetical protein
MELAAKSLPTVKSGIQTTAVSDVSFLHVRFILFVFKLLLLLLPPFTHQKLRALYSSYLLLTVHLYRLHTEIRTRFQIVLKIAGVENEISKLEKS